MNDFPPEKPNTPTPVTIQVPDIPALLKKKGGVLAIVGLFIWQAGENIYQTFRTLPSRFDDHIAIASNLVARVDGIELDIQIYKEQMNSPRKPVKDDPGYALELEGHRVEVNAKFKAIERERAVLDETLSTISQQLNDVSQYFGETKHVMTMFHEMNTLIEQFKQEQAARQWGSYESRIVTNNLNHSEVPNTGSKPKP